MIDTHKKHELSNGHGMSPVVAGLAGVVAGGVAVAAAVVMSDKKNQQKVKDALDGAKNKVAGYVDSVKSQPLVEKTAKKLAGK